MKIINLDICSWRLKRVIAINDVSCFNKLLIALPYTVCNGYSTSCTNIAQDLTFNNQLPKLNNVIKYSPRIQNNFLNMSRSRIVFHITSYNENKHGGSKTYHSSQYYNSVRYLSNVGIDPIAEVKVPMQFNSIFKAMSESTPIKITQDSLLLLHDYTGLPWWLIIILTTITMRTTVTLPLSLYQVNIISLCIMNIIYDISLLYMI